MTLEERLIHELDVSLLAWTLLSVTTTIIGLYAQPREFWRGFWFMSGLWGVIDGIIAWFGLINDPLPLDDLIRILQINFGLDFGYLLIGLLLYTRTRPLWKGFGAAILIQGLFLLLLDGFFLYRCGGW